ncbi:hypothetical protein T12_15896 [Trichinella patagoniensis]|uniref:Uncharacterized protein n=1 Tax=Trichinella patagoniensis TaxID=990121 RepID=A0A0V1AEP7_9BILA|nr:hypothetical protein T12_15896 [Trichinella patagoniensis]
MSNERLLLWNALNINIRSNNHLEGWHNRLDKNAGGSKLSWINRVYAVKQRLIIRYTGDYTSDCHYAMRQMQHPCLTGLSFPLLSSGTKESQ